MYLLTGWQTTQISTAAKLRSDCVVQIVWDYEFWVAGDQTTKSGIERWFDKSDLPLVAGSGVVKKMLEAMGRSSTVIRPGIDERVYRESVPIESRETTVGFILRPEPHKRVRDVINALELIRSTGRSPKVCAIGEWHEELPEWIEVLDAPGDNEVRAFYNACPVFVLPSAVEGLGLPALEAMACGCAVVVTDCGGVTDFAVNGENALIVPPGDPLSLATHVIRLLDDPDLRKRLSAAGKQTAKTFSWGEAVPALEAFLIAHLSDNGWSGTGIQVPRRSQVEDAIADATLDDPNSEAD